MLNKTEVTKLVSEKRMREFVSESEDTKHFVFSLHVYFGRSAGASDESRFMEKLSSELKKVYPASAVYRYDDPTSMDHSVDLDIIFVVTDSSYKIPFFNFKLSRNIDPKDFRDKLQAVVSKLGSKYFLSSGNISTSEYGRFLKKAIMSGEIEDLGKKASAQPAAPVK